MGKNRGFTLIELMVTIAVLAIIGSIAAPSMSNLMETRRFEKNFRELLLVLSQAKSQAVLNRGNVSANLNSNNTSTSTSKNWVVVDGYTNLSISPTVTASTFTYDQNGLISNIAADTTITLCNSKLKVKKMVVVTILGASVLKPDATVSTC